MTGARLALLLLVASLTLGSLERQAIAGGNFPPNPPPTDPDPEPEPTPEPEPEPDPEPDPEPPIGGGGDEPIDEDYDIPNDQTGLSPAPLNVVSRVPPNVLLILDNSESGQEGLDGRVAVGNNPGDRDNLAACQPNTFNASQCPAGARSPLSKSSIMKRVGRDLIERYRGDLNLGLMAYQQNPASRDRNSFSNGNTVVWRLTERALDVRYSTISSPSWYAPEFDGAWNATTKRYRTRLANSNIYAFFNVGVPGYIIVDRNSSNLPSTSDDRTEYWNRVGFDSNSGDQLVERYLGITTQNNNVLLTNRINEPSPRVPIVDSLRQRGIPNWGQNVLSLQLNQLEWRTTSSPGLGYLHVPIGGLNNDGTVNDAHWDAIETKLGTQRHEWIGNSTNPMIDPNWPLLATGLTPIEGTMYTARDYFLNNTGRNSAFGSAQGQRSGISIPNINNPDAQQCLVNANIWLTDGLPSVDRFGNSLGNNVSGALASAEAAIKRLYDDTNARLPNPVRTYVVGFNLPPDIANLPNVSDDPLGDLARAGGTERAYFANDEASLNQVMQQVLGNIIAASQSNTSAAVNSDEFGVEDGNLLYTAGFRSEDWSGRLAASVIEPDGSRSQRWNAETELVGQVGSRRLLTFQRLENGTRRGVLLSAENSGLNSAEVRWLQGETVSGLRPRQSLLGDIINANPVVLQGTENRVPLLLVAANDGMLHGFNAATGRELFGFLPAELTQGDAPTIRPLMQPDYNHRYFMDGTPAVREVNISGGPSAVAVGTMGAGGRTVFALDVSDPSSMRASDVLWEFRHQELGSGVTEPTITQLTNGTWVAIFSNGYNSTGYQASLFVVDLATGELLKHLKTDVGSAELPNGLATPTVTAWPSYNGARFAYAGDLAGNMWRFSLTGSGTVNRLYQGSASQPITSAPAVTLSSGSPETLLVSFGTGSYFRNGDIGDRSTQQLIGLRDQVNRSSTITQSDLLLQRITGENSQSGFNRRASSNFAPDSNDLGWRLELPAGERVIAAPSISSSLPRRVRFSTLLPDESDPCGGGRSGFFMSLLADTGGSGGSTTFDFNGDGTPDSDATIGDNAITGLQAGTGERLVGVNDGNIERLFVGNPDDTNASPNGDGSITIDFSDDHLGRRSWRQLTGEENDT